MEDEFKKTLNNIKVGFGKGLLGLNGGKPSVVTNALIGNKWNQNLPNFGGFVSPLPNDSSFLPAARVPLAPVNPSPMIQRNAPIKAPVAPRQVLSAKTVITPYPGQNEFVAMMAKKGHNPEAAKKTYQKAVTAPGFSGHYYGQKQPSPTPTPTQDKTPMPELTPIEKPTVKIFEQYKIHPAVAYGIASAEGGRIGSHNIWNINAVDSDPSKAFDYGNISEAAEGAAQTMRKLLAKVGESGMSPDQQLNAIEQAGYAGDPRTWKQRSIEQGGAGKYYDSWSDFVRATPGWRKWAQQRR